jgi:hypothetical protein
VQFHPAMVHFNQREYDKLLELAARFSKKDIELRNEGKEDVSRHGRIIIAENFGFEDELRNAGQAADAVSY